MLIKKPDDIPSREVTDEKVYLGRRNFMRAAILAGTSAASIWAYRRLNRSGTGGAVTQELANVIAAPTTNVADGFRTDEPMTPFEHITHYNNFYEFSLDKQAVAELAKDFVTRPWTVAVDGLVAKPTTFDLADLLKISPPEERIYRMRCVERWSMVIPWNGFSLSKILDRVEPLSSARYVAFQTLVDPNRMPNQRTKVLDWPYVEGLRMDEAMHPLTILASGIYGKQMPPQNGAPLRLVVPWKYGFKGIKSIVRITLTEEQPPTTWNLQASQEYGFYANVNPQVEHPRWSQANELRIGKEYRDTLIFNGYADQVAHLYEGMDLEANF